MAERAWAVCVVKSGAAGIPVVVVDGWVVLVLENGSVAGVAGVVGGVVAGGVCGESVFRMAGADRGPSSLEELGEPDEPALTRCPPPKPAKSAAMTAATRPKEARGVRRRVRRDWGRACFGVALVSRLRACFAT